MTNIKHIISSRTETQQTKNSNSNKQTAKGKHNKQTTSKQHTTEMKQTKQQKTISNKQAAQTK